MGAAAALAALVPAACAWSAAGSTGCALEIPPAPLPPGLEESSGAAVSGHRPDLVWTHGDSGADPLLHLVDLDGRRRATLRLEGARNVDWEALERADCGEGSCLWVADTGDNAGVREDAALHRVPEPRPEAVEALGVAGADVDAAPRAAGRTSEVGPDDPGAGDVARLSGRATRFPIRFPHGPRDVEALFVVGRDGVHLVTKGRRGPVTVYRYPPPLRPDRRVTLEEVQTLTEDPVRLGQQVTGAAASPDGRRVVVRTYEALRLHRMQEGRLVPVEGGEVRLRTLREPQGEAVALGEGARVVLTSEAGPLGRRGSLRTLRCPTPR